MHIPDQSGLTKQTISQNWMDNTLFVLSGQVPNTSLWMSGQMGTDFCRCVSRGLLSSTLFSFSNFHLFIPWSMQFCPLVGFERVRGEAVWLLWQLSSVSGYKLLRCVLQYHTAREILCHDAPVCFEAVNFPQINWMISPWLAPQNPSTFHLNWKLGCFTETVTDSIFIVRF